MHVLAKGNKYAAELGRLYDDIPKAVLAAIAVSYASTGGDHIDDAVPNILREWGILHENGIVPQKPPAPKKKAK